MNNLEALVSSLKEKGLTLGSVESMTGGLFASQITSVSGASKVFKGSLVTYATELKTKLANVDSKLIEKNGVVSGIVAEEMAKGGREVLGVDICVSITGNAGPTKCDGYGEVGDFFVGISTSKKTASKYFNIIGERNFIRQKAVEEMINYVFSEN